MPRAILKNGLIYPVEPLPPEWAEGQELEVQEVQNGAPSGLEQWYQELEAMAAQNDEEISRALRRRLKKRMIWASLTDSNHSP